MKAEKTKPIDIEKMTGNKEEDNKKEITEKELCEHCYGSLCTSCKYSKVCETFSKVKNYIPSHYVNVNTMEYIGNEPDKVWRREGNVTIKPEEKKNSMKMKEIKNENENESKEDNNMVENFFVCADEKYIKYPINGEDEYVCVFDGSIFGNYIANIKIIGCIINIYKDNITIYNKNDKNICMIDLHSIRCLLPKSIYDLFGDNKQ